MKLAQRGMEVRVVLAAGPSWGEVRRATITRVLTTAWTCELQAVLLPGDADGELECRVPAADYDPTGRPGTWHWPEEERAP